MADHHLDPVVTTISFVVSYDSVDYFLIGVNSARQLQYIEELEPYKQKDVAILDTLQLKTVAKWLDPRS